MKKTNGYFIKWVIYALAFSVILLAFGWLVLFIEPINDIAGNMLNSLRDRGFSEDNIYAVEISSTFIVVSLVSFLSGSGEDVLWENTVRYSLVSPKIVNFISITVFLVVDLSGATIAFWTNQNAIFFALFIIDLVLLIIMTYKMIGAFFARASIKQKLVNDFKSMKSSMKAQAIEVLYDKTLTFINENKLRLAEENMDFLSEQEELSILALLMDFLSKKIT